MADWRDFPVEGGDVLRIPRPPQWVPEPRLPIGRPYDGAVVDGDGRLVIPSPPQQKDDPHG